VIGILFFAYCLILNTSIKLVTQPQVFLIVTENEWLQPPSAPQPSSSRSRCRSVGFINMSPVPLCHSSGPAALGVFIPLFTRFCAALTSTYFVVFWDPILCSMSALQPANSGPLLASVTLALSRRGYLCESGPRLPPEHLLSALFLCHGSNVLSWWCLCCFRAKLFGFISQSHTLPTVWPDPGYLTLSVLGFFCVEGGW
jgi:hypothetical protein